MPSPIQAVLGDAVFLSLVKGQFVEPMWAGMAAKGLIDPQDTGTMVEASMVLVSKLYPRLLAAAPASS